MDKHPVEAGTDYRIPHLEIVVLQKDTVLLAFQQLQGFIIIGGSQQDFEEYLVDFLCCFLVNGLVRNQHSAERGNRIGRQSIPIGFEQARTDGQAASVVVLQYSESRFGPEILHQSQGRIDIEQVVVRNLLAVQLLETFVERTVESTFLMRVLAIAQRSGIGWNPA